MLILEATRWVVQYDVRLVHDLKICMYAFNTDFFMSENLNRGFFREYHLRCRNHMIILKHNCGILKVFFVVFWSRLLIIYCTNIVPRITYLNNYEKEYSVTFSFVPYALCGVSCLPPVRPFTNMDEL